MQVTRPAHLTEAQAKAAGRLRQEFFAAGTEGEVEDAMDDRLEQLPKERLVRRVKIGRNDLCPCNSGRKFKRCCISQLRSR